MNFISYGGGVQSTAMVLMTLDDSAKSWKKSDVDLVIMADPGDEMPSTYETARLIEEKCKKAGLEFVRVQKEGQTLREHHLERGTLTMVGISSCTVNWKIQPIRKFIKKQVNQSAEKPWATAWLGITTDEARRVADSDVKWVSNRFPLIEEGMSRTDCENYIKNNHPELNVSKSGCFFCHYQPKKAWAELKRKHPDLFQLALEWERFATGPEGKVHSGGLNAGQSIEKFNHSHTLEDFGFELEFDNSDFDCNAVGGCFI